MKIGWMGREMVEMEARPEVLLLMMKAEKGGCAEGKHVGGWSWGEELVASSIMVVRSLCGDCKAKRCLCPNGRVGI